VQVIITNKQRRRIDKPRLGKVAEAVMASEGCHPSAELSVVIGDDAWIRRLNREYRKQDAATDVLAFSQEAGPAGSVPLLGDVGISAETAARQAKELGHTLMAEIEVLLAHGILHLTGWNDGTAAERKQMMQRVQAVLERVEGEPRQ